MLKKNRFCDKNYGELKFSHVFYDRKYCGFRLFYLFCGIYFTSVSANVIMDQNLANLLFEIIEDIH